MILSTMLGCGVLTGLGAVVVDVGRLYVERGNLQGAADAAADAVARACATGVCKRDPLALAREIAGKNVNDADDTPDDPPAIDICGFAIDDSRIPQCGPLIATNLTQCIGERPTSRRWVEARTSTHNPDRADPSRVPGTLVRTLGGEEDYAGTTVGACARAVVDQITGVIVKADSIGLTVSRCSWEEFTGGGAHYAGSSVSASDERVLNIKDSGGSGWAGSGASDCNTGGANAPGNWGWLDTQAGGLDCEAVFTRNGVAGGDGGNNTESECLSLLQKYRSERKPLLIPLFDDAWGNGNNTEYHIAGFGAWVVTGYFLTGGGAKEKSWLTNKHHCSGNERCVYGYFVSATFTATPDTVVDPDPNVDFGADSSRTTVRLAG